MTGSRRVVTAALGVAAVVLVTGATLLIVFDHDSEEKKSLSPRTLVTSPTAVPQTTATPPSSTTASAPASTSASSQLPESPWRAGYAGLGPIQLGVTVEEAVRTARAVARPTDGGCLIALDPGPGSELAASEISVTPGTVSVIYIGSPRFHTISGIHIGSTDDDVRRTYGAVESYRDGDRTALVIRNPQGRAIYFPIRDHQVVGIWIAESEEALEGNASC